jgi:hypothetical protein
MTPVFEVPLTAGLNVVLWPPVSDALLGDKLMLTVTGGALGCNITATDAVLVGSAALDAVSVIVSCDVILAGAV